MNRPAWFEHNDVVAWLILGYLCSNPDAKDTAEGVEKWWLNGKGIDMDAKIVRTFTRLSGEVGMAGVE